MNWAWHQAPKPVPKQVLMALADAADDEGVCWPSAATIAGKVGVSTRTVRQRMEAAQAHVELPTPGPIDEDGPLVRRMMEIAQRSCKK